MRTKTPTFFFLVVFFMSAIFFFCSSAFSGPTQVTIEGITFPDGTTQTTAASGGGSSLWSQSGSNIYYNSGNVGIGTSSPTGKLHIKGSTFANLFIEAKGGYDHNLIFEQDGKQTWLIGYDDSAEMLRFRQGDDSAIVRMVIKDSGNVGIGTESPFYKLHVNGDAAGTSWTNLSSRQYKEDIRRVDESSHPMMLARLMDVDITTYKYKEECGGNGATKLGFIAEEMPDEVLSEDGKGVDLYELLAMTIGAMKAQQKQIAAQQKENEILKSELAKIMARLQALEKSEHAERQKRIAAD